MKTTNDIQKEALAAQQEGAWLEEQEAENNQNSELGKVLQYLAPMVRNLLVLGKPLWLLR